MYNNGWLRQRRLTLIVSTNFLPSRKISLLKIHCILCKYCRVYCKTKNSTWALKSSLSLLDDYLYISARKENMNKRYY